MQTRFRNSLSARLFHAAIMTAPLLISGASQAQNTAYGVNALHSDTTGSYNTAMGIDALFFNTTGSSNTATGYGALVYNTTGSNNTANGYDALFANNAGSYNTANGESALLVNNGYYNTANGYDALYHNNTGGGNTANGLNSLFSNTTAWYNTANGYQALYSNTTGVNNTASGVDALEYNSAGSYNVADGFCALLNNTGSSNIALGYYAGQNLTTGSNNIDIGANGTAGESHVIRIGGQGTQQATFIAGIYPTPLSGYEVVVNANGQLGILGSSRRFKNDIKDMGNASDKIYRLRCKVFRYKDSVERGPHSLQYGLIAEEVAKVYPDLVQYDKAGKPFTVNYHLLTPMLLNELQKEHHRSEAQKMEITAQQTEIAAMKAAHNAEIAALKTTLQTQSTELAALKQTQHQQLKVLAKLAAFVQPTQTGISSQKAVFVQQ